MALAPPTTPTATPRERGERAARLPALRPPASRP